MNHLSDKDLDRLSKEAAEQYDVQQNTSGWDQLHRKLNKELPVQGKDKRRRFLFLLLFFAILTGGGIIYSYLNSPAPKTEGLQVQQFDSNTSEKISPQNTPEIKSAERTAADKETLSENQKGGESILNENSRKPDQPEGKLHNSEAEVATRSSNIPERKENKSTQQNNTVRQPDNRIAQQTLSTDLKNLKGKNKDGKKRQSNYNQPVNRNQPSIAIIEKQKPTDENEHVVTEKKDDSREVVIDRHEPAAVNKNEPLTSEPAVIESAKAQKQVATSEKDSKKAKATVSKNYPFSILVVAGPDLSNVNFRFKDKPGFNAGLRFSWQFAPRFSLSTGAVYTKKNYSALGRDYNPPKGYWTNYVTIDKVTGSCWMIDIPLEVRYDIHSGKNSKWFVSSGLSTYLMDKEDYEYHYMYNGSYTVRRWINNKNSDYILSIANLSAGYEKKISRHISIQAEPYLKVPLKGVGFGKMQMNSYGLNLSVRYGFSMMTKKITPTSP